MMARRIQVFGKVQGVFFRASAKTIADDLGLNGWVRNEQDGSVLIEVEGMETNVEKMVEWCEEGPTFAKVNDVILAEAEEVDFESFEIRY